MQKIVSIILLTAILLTGNIALVQGSSLSKRHKSPQTQPNYRTSLAELTPLQENVRTNSSEIISQQAAANTAYNKAKKHIKELIQNRDSLTPAQIESIKVSLDVIKQDKESLEGTIGKIQKETLNLRTAKKEKHFEGVSNSFNGIITVQKDRIKDLQRIIIDLNNAAAL